MPVRGLAPSDLGPTLETARLILRPPCEDDLEPLSTFLGDPVATLHIGGPKPRSLAWRLLATVAGAWAMRGFGMFAAIEKDTGRWIGQLGPWRPADWPGNEVGWTFAREAWGKGYATEAATAAMDWAFDTLDWTDVIHTIAPANAASIAVAERLGSRQIGPVVCPPPFDLGDPIAWGQTREDWAVNRERLRSSRPS